MNPPETFEEWERRTAPSPESVALAQSAPLSIYLIGAFVVVALSTADYGDKLAILAFLAGWYPTGVLAKRWLRDGAKLNERRFVRLRWVRFAMFGALLFAVSVGSARDILLAASLLLLGLPELRWHLMERLGRWRLAIHQH